MSETTGETPYRGLAITPDRGFSGSPPAKPPSEMEQLRAALYDALIQRDARIASLEAALKAAREGLERVAGGSFPGASTLAIAGDWHGMYGALQFTAAVAIAQIDAALGE